MADSMQAVGRSPSERQAGVVVHGATAFGVMAAVSAAWDDADTLLVADWPHGATRC